ncbi:MAG: ankyrin repeat domain-containing protein [Planctomycetota bacterium]
MDLKIWGWNETDLHERYRLVQHSGFLDEIDVDLPLIVEKPGRGRDPKGGHVLFVCGAQAYSKDVDDLVQRRMQGVGADEYEALLAASWQGNDEQVKSLLANQALVNARCESRWTPLMKASFRGHTKIVGQLLEAGAYVNAVSESKTALNLAARKGHLEIVKLLLKYGATLEPIAAASWTPYSALCAAAANGHTSIVEALINHGLSMKTTDANDALNEAAFRKYFDTVKLMVANGADINGRGKYGGNAMVTAFHANRPDIMEFLISMGADVNVQDKEGYTALSYMVCNGDTEAVKILLKAGADAHAKGLHNMSLLERAIQSGRSEIADALRQAGAKE